MVEYFELNILNVFNVGNINKVHLCRPSVLGWN